ncbi:MAG: TolC family protein, partial [Pseudomonadota bacterium]
MKRLPTLAGLGLAAGCASVGDRLENPPLDPTGSTPESPSTFTAGEASNEAPRADWLAQFNDPIMVSLVREALAANPTLASSTANVRAAMAAARATFGRAARPTVDLSGSAGEATTGIAGFTGAGGARTFETTFDVAANFRWELDLWGRLSAQIAAGQADLLASEADLAAAELSIAAQTANAWIDLNSSKSLLR